MKTTTSPDEDQQFPRQTDDAAMNATTSDDDDQQFLRQTDDAASKIAQEFNRTSRSLIIMGKTVKDYIAQTDGIEGDAFRRLASSPKIPVSATALRAYLAAYLLWETIAESETPPEVCPTAYGVVAQAAGLKPAEKARLLKAAKEQNWSVSEIRRQIKQARKPDPASCGRAKAKQDAVSTDCHAIQEFNQDLAGLIQTLTTLTLTAGDPSASDEVRKNCRHFVGLLLLQKIIERDWILAQMPGDLPAGSHGEAA